MKKSQSAPALASFQKPKVRQLSCAALPDLGDYIKTSSIVNASIANLIQCNATFPDDLLVDRDKAICVATPSEVPDQHQDPKDRDFDRLAQLILRNRRWRRTNAFTAIE